MKIVREPSTGLLFMVVVLGMLGLVMGQSCDGKGNTAALACGLTCGISFSQTNVLASKDGTYICFCKDKVGGDVMIGSTLVDARVCKENTPTCMSTGTECPDGQKLYQCVLRTGKDAESLNVQNIKLCACGTDLAPAKAAEQNQSGGRRGKLPPILAKLLAALQQVSRFYGRQ